MKRRDLLAGLLVASVAGAAPASEKKGEKKPTGSFVALGAVSATVSRGGGRRGVMSVECGLDVPDEALRDTARSSLPRLRAGYVQVLQVYAAGLKPAEPPRPDLLGQSLQRQTDVVLGRRGARLLLGSIVVN